MTVHTSPEQGRVINTGDCNLLVSAAAGSGKTYTLVQRIMHHLLDEGYSLDDLLVVTFTRAAALEMRQRIEQQLRERVSEQPALATQLTLLPSADISTLHSFCQSLLRQHFAAIDLDPKFRLANQHELALICNKVMAEVFEARYAAEDPQFLRLVELYGQDRSDEKLYKIVTDLHRFAQSQPDPEAWLRTLADAYDLPPEATLRDTPWHEELRADISRRLADIAESARFLRGLANATGFPDYAAQLAADEELLRGLLPAIRDGDFDDWRAAIAQIDFPDAKGDKGGDSKLRGVITDQRRSKMKNAVKVLREDYFQQDAQGYMADLRQVQPMAEAMSRLVLDYTAALQRAKRKKLLLDFSDLEHLALRLLRLDEVGSAVRQRFREVLVDEYQDINGVQEAILQQVANGRNLFVVGDVKQSIYLFRMADPSLFSAKQTGYAEDATRGRALFLSENYRSRREILAAVNFVFAQLMHKPELELDYDEDAALYAKSEYPECANSFGGQAVELALLTTPQSEDEEEEKQTAALREARWIAQRLRKIHDDGTLVWQQAERRYRPIRWRDMAVLLRAARGKAQPLVEALRAADVPAYADVDAGYFEELEVRVVLALLAVIDNARQDIALAAVLHSPIVGLTADDLAALRLDTPKGDFSDAVNASTLPKVVRFRERLTRWRGLAQRLGVPELLWQLYRETGYYDYVGAQPGGLVRQANLRMLIDRASDYEQTNFRGLFRFLQFVRSLNERGNDLAIARVLGENEDVVRVMTVHKSKGLEFPVVVIANLGKQFNLDSSSGDILMHRRLGLGMSRVEQSGTLTWRYPTAARLAVSARIVRELKSEELRMLYVAMTRAREKLILVGSCAHLNTAAQRWCRYCAQSATAIPGHAVLSAKSLLDWVAMAVARDQSAGESLRRLANLPGNSALEYPSARYGAPQWSFTLVDRALSAPDANLAGDAASELRERIRNLQPLPVAAPEERDAVLGWQYPHRLDLPVKVTVSELKRAHDPDEVSSGLYDEHATPLFAAEADEFAQPRFLRDTLGRTAAAYGTLMHAVLQRLDLSQPLDAGGIRAQLARLPLSDEERNAVDVRALATFFASPLGRRLLNAPLVCREQPFTLMLPASTLDAGYPPDEHVAVQGVIDLFFVDAEGRAVLVDYKTDRHTTPQSLTERYRVQLQLYARALRQLARLRVDDCYLYRLADGDAVAVDVGA